VHAARLPDIDQLARGDARGDGVGHVAAVHAVGARRGHERRHPDPRQVLRQRVAEEGAGREPGAARFQPVDRGKVVAEHRAPARPVDKREADVGLDGGLERVIT